MALTRYKKFTGQKKHETRQEKFEDLLLCSIYLGLNIFAFILFVSITTNDLKHIDFDLPAYLPLELSHPAQL